MRNTPITGSTHILCVGLRVNSTIPVSWYSDRQDLYHALLVCFSPVSILCHEQRSQTSVRCVLEILPQRVDIATKNKCYLNDSIISSNLLTTWVFPSISLKERRGKHNFLAFSDWTRKCTLWRCKSTPTPKAKLLWMTSHYGPTVVRSVTEIPCHVFIW